MKEKRFLLLIMIPIFLCNCGNDRNINWELNNGWDITICNHDIYIAYRMNNDLYIAESQDGTIWQKRLIHKGDLFDCRLSCANDSVNLIITDYKKGLLYFNNVELNSNYETLINVEQSSVYAHSSTVNTFGLPVVSVAKLWERSLFFFIKENDLWDVTQYKTTKNITENLGAFIDSNDAIHNFLIIDNSFSECGEIFHLYEENNNWQNEILGQCVSNAAVAKDNNGLFHLIYDEYIEEHQSYRTHYLIRGFTGWNEVELTKEIKHWIRSVYGNIFFAIDIDNISLLAYKNDSFYIVKNNNGEWSKKDISPDLYHQSSGSLFVDEENNAHISFINRLDFHGPITKLYYVTNKTGEWVRHEVDFTP